MRARVDREICIGCGLCESVCPDIFKILEDGLADTIMDEVPDEHKESAREAETECPVTAIIIEE